MAPAARASGRARATPVMAREPVRVGPGVAVCVVPGAPASWEAVPEAGELGRADGSADAPGAADGPAVGSADADGSADEPA